jgi:hypothetical protein
MTNRVVWSPVVTCKGFLLRAGRPHIFSLNYSLFYIVTRSGSFSHYITTVRNTFDLIKLLDLSSTHPDPQNWIALSEYYKLDFEARIAKLLRVWHIACFIRLNCTRLQQRHGLTLSRRDRLRVPSKRTTVEMPREGSKSSCQVHM